ncbi:subtilase family protein [Wolffia australiana]
MDGSFAARPAFFLFLSFLILSLASGSEEKATYIVRFARSEIPAEFAEHSHWYDASLQAVSDSAEVLYTYGNVAHGVSARLTPDEAAALGSRPGVVAVLPEARYELHTTRTPEFLGLSSDASLWPESDSGSEVVVGVLDTGVWPEIRSYDDSGFGPVPESWKGGCDDTADFKAAVVCNKKLIGARFFSKGYEASNGPIDESKESKSPRDGDGHGTHTSSTAAGSFVPDASLFGFAAGTARGMAPRARVAVYKVCWAGGCFTSDILAAIDRAVEDGVDVLSLSLGGGNSDYYRDGVAVGAFAAMERGILVSCSAGNSGPGDATLSNVAPWITTVGAGTIDRDFPAYVALGNGKNYTGVSLYSGKPPANELVRMVYAGNATNATSKGNLCLPGTLIPEKVAGKIVLCDRGVNARVQKGFVVKDAGGVGMVLANTAANGEELVADAHFIPAAAVGQKAGDAIRSYVLSDPSPAAFLVFGGTKVGVQPSPVAAAFSARGPNAITPGILKPDLIAPGVNILAGWSGGAGPTGLAQDSRRTEFNIISGTSMSCPHVSGLAALLKSARPGWSPAAIKSALMTTAYDTSKSGAPLLDVATGNPATPFVIGSGHADPVRAMDPGLVYDLTAEDYLGFLCAVGYTPLQISAMSSRNFSCDAGGKKYSLSDFNYPSFSVPFETATVGGASGVTTVKHTRTLTNVGQPGTYTATVSTAADDVKVVVEPAELSFEREGDKKTYTVIFSAPSQPSGTASFARLTWSDGKHKVASPIAFTWT